MKWLIHWPPRVFKVYLESLAACGGEAPCQHPESPKRHRSRTASIQEMENCTSLWTQPGFYRRLSPVNASSFCLNIENTVVASRVQLGLATCFRFWVGWFRREERLDWNSETGDKGLAREPFFKCPAERWANALTFPLRISAGHW
jgi:hypothetical protein